MLASINGINFSLLLFSIVGITLVLCSATSLNNYLDRDIDKLMTRTAERVSKIEHINPFVMLIISSVFFILGCLTIYFFVNLLTLIVTLVGYFVYVVVYTMFLKRTSVYSTVVGSLSGAVLPLAGYVAVANTIDLAGILLFLILLIWQMPHFYAIGIYRLNDYTQAKIQILPVQYGITRTKYHMFAWSMLFLVVIFLPYVYGFVGIIYLVPTVIIFIFWSYLAVKGFFVQDDIKWAKQTFFLSIMSLTTLCLSIIFDVLI